MESGVYETTYGNAAVVSEWACVGYDLDMGQVVPLSMVTGKRLRDAEEGDLELLDAADMDADI